MTTTELMEEMTQMRKCHSSYTIGIDVGSKGSLCVLEDLKLKTLIPFKSIKSYLKELLTARKVYALGHLSIYVESVHSMPKQGVKSMFSFGQRFGEIIGVLEAYDLCYNLVSPQQWQKTLYEQYDFPINKDNVKLSIGEFINSKYGKSVNLLKRTGSINTDLTDSIAIALSYAEKSRKGG